MKLPVVELFHSVQGEGIYTGVPSIFLRVTGCNLRCVFKDSICDTSYTSFNPEKPIFADMDQLEFAIGTLKAQYPNTKHLVITGGEPMLYKYTADIIEYIDKNYRYNTHSKFLPQEKKKELLLNLSEEKFIKK